MCSICRTRPRSGSAVHASTHQHRRAVALRTAFVIGDRLARGRPAWSVSLERWNDQYAEEEEAAIARGWTPGGEL